MSKLETYGQSKRDLQNSKNKIAKQKKYLESQTFISESGDTKCLLDVSYSANVSERYYPRILNKVNTFVSTGMNQDLVPIFLTVTADGFFRRFMKGDYKEWTTELRDRYKKHIPNNDRNGFYLDYLDNHNQLTPKDVYRILSHQLRFFMKSKVLQDIRKFGKNYSSIRVTEPHKDGIPHFHILMYVPVEYIPRVYKAFMRSFPAPQNHKKLTWKNTKGKHRRNGHYVCDVKGVKMYETKGFQTQVGSAAGYILKYILKSFRNLIEGKEMDYLQSWYVHNKIPRLITTHTLVSQEVYHKASLMENDWYYLTDIKFNGGFTNDRLNDYFKFDDGCGRTIVVDSGLYVLSNQGRLISTYGKKENFIPTYRLRSLKWSDKKDDSFNILAQYNIYVPPKKYSFYINKIYDDGTFFVFGGIDDFYIESGFTGIAEVGGLKPISKYSDLELYNHYVTFDFDEYMPPRYAVLHNEMIDRGLIRQDYLNPNDFNASFGVDTAIASYQITKGNFHKVSNEDLLSFFNGMTLNDENISLYSFIEYDLLSRELISNVHFA